MAHDVDKETELARRLWAVTTTSPEAQQAVTGVLNQGGQSHTEVGEIEVPDRKGRLTTVQVYRITNEVRLQLLDRQTDTPFVADFYWSLPGADDTWHKWKKGRTVGREAVAQLIRSTKLGKRIDFADRLPKRHGVQVDFVNPPVGNKKNK